MSFMIQASGGCICVMHLCYCEAKLSNLKLKTFVNLSHKISHSRFGRFIIIQLLKIADLFDGGYLSPKRKFVLKQKKYLSW